MGAIERVEKVDGTPVCEIADGRVRWLHDPVPISLSCVRYPTRLLFAVATTGVEWTGASFARRVKRAEWDLRDVGLDGIPIATIWPGD